MTAIVGYIENGVVYLGGDSCSSSGSKVWVRTTPKVWRAGECVVGVTGIPTTEQLLRHAFEWPTIEADQDPEIWVAAQFVPALRDLLQRHGQVGRFTTGEIQGGDAMDSNVVIGLRGRLFEVCAAFQVLEVADGFTATGSGQNEARGALHALQKCAPGLNPGQRVICALEAAARFDNSVCGPFTLVCTWGAANAA